jgi:23S rRNA (cytosine1962-C5)-methyltransferase
MGMEVRRHLLIEALQETIQPVGIVARNDVSIRRLEGLEEKTEVLSGKIPGPVEIQENGLRFRVDLMAGQKTGHFLDQKDNHELLRRFASGKEVLDCFCYSGSWGIHASAYGASRVTCIDASERAIGLARENAALNGLTERMDFVVADVFEQLRDLKSTGRLFDLIVLDPPAFIKSRKVIREGEKGYLTINRRALELLRPGGILITCSCSHLMGREDFRSLLAIAAQKAHKTLRLLAVRTQAQDHPVLLAVPESEYLKCMVLQVV